MRHSRIMIPGITGEVIVATTYVVNSTYLQFLECEIPYNNILCSYLEYPLNEYDSDNLISLKSSMPKQLYKLLDKAYKEGAELLWVKVRK